MFVTLMIVLLMIMVGMGLDTGHLVYVRSQGQAAVDAATLAAVSGLPVSQAEVEARAAAYASTNNYLNSPNNLIDSTNVSYIQYDSSTGNITDSPFAGANGVRVALEKKNPYSGTTTNNGMISPLFLTPLLNLLGSGSAQGKSDIGVSAVAAVTAKPSIPIAIFNTTCNNNDVNDTGKVPDVLIRQSSSPADNSCWTSYLINPPSAKQIQELFQATATCTGTPTGNIGVGTPIQINNGQQNSDYADAQDLFYPYNPTNKCWIVPIVTKDTSCTQVSPILGWGKICPTDVQKTGSPKYIKADVYCGQTLNRLTDALCFTPRLLRETKVGM